MKVTFDTNILISSTLWQNSVSRKLLNELIEKSVEIFTTEEILEEYIKVLKRDFDLSQEEIKDKIEIILCFVTITNPLIEINVIKEDSADNKILECAVESGSEYILSYDRHLLSLIEFRGIRIITPEEFLYTLKK
ncbi:MAG: putative toxin-antitoxin system toxin component, PIN family [Nanoarchaeota archaeon]